MRTSFQTIFQFFVGNIICYLYLLRIESKLSLLGIESQVADNPVGIGSRRLSQLLQLHAGLTRNKRVEELQYHSRAHDRPRYPGKYHDCGHKE
jgi:hypothetical protein